MNLCERLRPLLSHVAEGEAGPDEAMATARHLSDCTACRIQLARERRLAAMLERDLEDQLQVGEEFVQAVMAHLPQGPPPPPPRGKKTRRVLIKLAALAGLPGVGSWLMRGGFELPAGPLLPSLPIPDLRGLEGHLEAASGLARLVLMVLDAARLPWIDGPGGGLPILTAIVALLALATLATVAPLLVLATHSVLRPR